MYFSVGRFEPGISMALRSTRSEILGADTLLNVATNTSHINVGDLNVPVSCVRRTGSDSLESLIMGKCFFSLFSYLCALPFQLFLQVGALNVNIKLSE